MPYTVERYHDFSAGHRVFGHESKCAHLHGHNYRVHFTCAAGPGAVAVAAPTSISELDAVGRVIDFGEVKDRLCEWVERSWDHCMLIWSHDPMLEQLRALDWDGVVPIPFNPTAENMARYLVEVVGPIQLKGTGIVLTSCRVEETRKCTATYTLP